MIDEFRTVVGVQFPNGKKELVQHGLHHRQHMLLSDLRHASQYLPLRHLIHGIEMIHSLGPVPVSLMHAVDPQVSRNPSGIRTAPFPDGDRSEEHTSEL